jgi:hypothetical protein
MKHTIAAVLLISVLGTPAFAQDPWTNTDTALAVTYAGLAIVDLGQTINGAETTNGHEMNPLLGRHPSRDKLIAFTALYVPLNTYIAYRLPHPYRRIWQALTIAVDAACVAHNYSIGLKVKF